MRDTTDILLTAIYTAISGRLTYNGQDVPVFDEKKLGSDTHNLYVICGTQQEVPANNTQGVFITDSSIDLEVTLKTTSEISKRALSEVANQILTILLPTQQEAGIVQPSDMQIQNLKCAGTITRAFIINNNESIVTKFIKLTATMVQQEN